MGVYMVKINTDWRGQFEAFMFVTEKGENIWMKSMEALNFIAANQVINARVVDGKIVPVPNDYSRYFGARSTILTRIVGSRKGYRIYDHYKGVGLYSERQAFELIKDTEATNAKAVEREGTKFISALEGTFPEERLKSRKTPENIKEVIESLVPYTRAYYKLSDDKYLVLVDKGDKLTYLVELESKRVIDGLDRYVKNHAGFEHFIMDVRAFGDSIILAVLNKYDGGDFTVSIVRVDKDGKTERITESENLDYPDARYILGRSKLSISKEGEYFINIIGRHNVNIGYCFGSLTKKKYFTVGWSEIRGSEQPMECLRAINTTHHNKTTGEYTDIRALLEPGKGYYLYTSNLQVNVKLYAIRYRKLENKKREVIWESVVNRETVQKYGLIESGIIPEEILIHSEFNIYNDCPNPYADIMYPRFGFTEGLTSRNYYFVYAVREGLKGRKIYVQRIVDGEPRIMYPDELRKEIDKGTIKNIRLENDKIVPTVGNIKDYIVKPYIKVTDKNEKNKDGRIEVYKPKNSMILIGRADWADDLYIASCITPESSEIRAYTEKELIAGIGKKDKNNISNYWVVDGHIEVSGRLEVMSRSDVIGVEGLKGRV